MDNKEWNNKVTALQIQVEELTITMDKLKNCIIDIESRLSEDNQKKKAKKNLLLQVIEILVLVGMFIASMFIKK